MPLSSLIPPATRVIVSCLVLFLTTLGYAEEPRGQIIGTIIDGENNQPVVSANVLLVGTTTGTTTGLDGRFSIEGVAAGTYTLRCSLLGYVTLNRTDVVVSPGHATQVNIAMTEQPVTLTTEVVTEGLYFFAPLEVTTSDYRLNYEEIRRSAGGLGDVTRLVQSMPGIVSPSDQRNDLVVRGGSPSENLTIVDNIEIPNLNHFAAQGASGGPIGMLNTEFINQADFLAGGFPAQYGNRLSSVMNVDLREGSRDHLSGSLDLGLAGAGGLIEGPIAEQGSWMVAARRSYLDLLAGPFGLTAIPRYSNYQAKVVYDIDPSNKLWLMSIGGIDRIHFEVDSSDTEDPSLQDIQSSGWRTVTGVNWQQLWGTAGYGTLSISDALSDYEQDIHDAQFGNRQVFFNQTREGETTAKYDAALQLGTLGQLTAGASGKYFRNTFTLRLPYGRRNPFSADSTRVDTTDVEGRYHTSTAGGYVQLSRSVLNTLTITAGIRYDYYAYAEASKFSPRLGLTIPISSSLILDASFGKFYQMPGLVFMYVVPENLNLSPIRATHYIAGLSYYPSPDIKISVEGYVKDYADYPVSLEYPTYSLANSGDEYGVADRLFPMVSRGSGTSKGVEVYLQKKLTGSFYGQISYSYSETQHQALDRERRPGGFDIPHVFTLVGGYKINESWEFSGKFSFASGRPFTPALEPASQQQNRYVLDLARVNAERSPSYSRLDLRVDYRAYFGGWNLVTYFEVENVYNRKNVFQYIWNPKTGKLDELKQIGFFPFGGFKVEF